MAGLRIFETDPDAMPKPKQGFTKPEYTFQVRGGMSVNNKGVNLPTWRFLSGQQTTINALGQLYGGTPEEYDASKVEHLHLVSEAKELEVVIAGSKAVRSRMILWGRSGPIHECDGVEFLSPAEDVGKPCGCPSSLAERKDWAKSGRGPSPHIEVDLTLAQDQELGLAKFQTGSWKLAEVLHHVKDDLDRVGGEALVSLEREYVSFTTKAGKFIEYIKPTLRVIGSYSDAVGEER